ncbi:MAG: hypothetical protein RIT27_666 [Pseudomonadota bacterium]
MSILKRILKRLNWKDRQLSRLATHITSESKFQQALRRESARSDRNGQGFSLAVFELKELAHPTTQALIDILRYRLRGTDEAGWLGGQQYLGVILFATPQKSGAESFIYDVFKKLSNKNVELPAYQIYLYPKDWRLPDDINSPPD